MNIINQLAFLWYIPFISGLLFQGSFPQSSVLPDNKQEQNTGKAAASNIVFKSADGGKTWLDISEGLPQKLQDDNFFANENGLYLTAENGIYHSMPNAKAPFWKKEISPDNHNSIAHGKAGVFAYNFNGQFLQEAGGTGASLPVYTNFEGSEVRTVFESTGGTVFLASNNQLFKSTNSGKTWKPVSAGGLVMDIAESKGVLLATGAAGILRSTDDGENWNWVIREGGVGIAVEPIKGGFAAITYNAALKTRRVRTSYDGGKTWQAIDAGLPASLSITSVIQVGEYFFCGHPKGIYRSADNGKTWKLLLPSVGKKVFNLSVSGNVIYAIPRDGGC